MNLNNKNYFSIVLMEIINSNYNVDIGAFGKDCNSAIFKEIIFWKILDQKKLNINDILSYTLVGDEAFALSEHLLRP